MLDYILLRVPISPPQAFIHSSSPFPSDHFPVSLSLPLHVSKQEPELWETKRRYDLPDKIPLAMGQRFNMCFAQHIPSNRETHTPLEIFHFIQRSILQALETVFGPPGSVSSTPSVVITQQRALSNFFLKTPCWWATLRHVATFLQLREQIHSAWRVIGLERQLGVVPLPRALEPPSGSSYRVIYRKPYSQALDPKYVISVSIPPICMRALF